MTQSSPKPVEAAPPSAAWGASPGPRRATSGLAVASLVLGLLSFLFVPAILAVIFGNLALERVRDSGGTVGGRGLAIAGVVLGWVGILLALAAAGAWLGYNLSNG